MQSENNNLKKAKIEINNIQKFTFLFVFFFLFFIYQEVIFSLAVFHRLTFNCFYTILFSIPISGIVYLLTNVFKAKINHIISYIFIIFFTIIYGAQFVYNHIYQSVISFYSFLGGGQVFQFAAKIVSVILNNWWYILLIILPLIIFVILDLKKVFDFRRVSLKRKTILFGSLLCIHFATVFSLNIINTKEMYSNTHLYNDVHAPLLTTERFGVMTMMRLDIKRYVFGFKEKDLTPNTIPNNKQEEIEKNPEKPYNVLEIDFDKLISNSNDNVIKNMHEYFKNQSPTKQNDYTGMFEGKNLIVFVAEAFSQLAIDKELTPSLYKLYNEGFQFTNFYTPLYPVSTADGEYMTDTSLIPKEGVWSIYQVRNNYMPFSYANMFEKLNYKTYAYHNNTYNYYKRDQYINAMGYDSYKACRKGLNINCKIWPESDLEMINASVQDYINDEHFLAYYMTVSGHLEYSRLGNMMVSKNWSKVKDLNLSDKAKSYLAANIEFDRAVEQLLKELEKAGKLENTVIAISGDHYPYGLELSEINELSTYERDKEFEIHHMPFLIWSGSMKESIKIDKIGSSLDVVPTLYNLFNIKYDSRLFMGTDLLSSSSPLVIFSNRSFITDKGRYNAVKRNFIPNPGVEVDDDYVNNINAIVYNKFKYSKLVLENDYYRKLYNELGWEIKS